MPAILLSGLMAVCIATLPLHAGETKKAAESAERYFFCIKESRWNDAADLMHPDALASFKKMFGGIAESGGMEYIKLVFTVKDINEYQAADPKVLFSRLMRYLVKTSPGYGDAVTRSAYQIKGVAREDNADDAYVVYLLTVKVEGMAVEKLTVIPMKKHNDVWLVMLTGDMKNMAEALKKRYGSR